MTMENKNLKHVQTIVADMADFASGNFFIYDGELFPIDKGNFCKKEGCLYCEGTYIMPNGEKIPEDEIEVATIGDYFDEFYDIDYIIDREKHYKACRVLVAFGGPNIYIDTWEKEVQLYWWSDTATADIPVNICDEIDEFFKMLYEC